MNAWIARCVLPVLLWLACAPAAAQLAQYGYVVGTLEPDYLSDPGDFALLDNSTDPSDQGRAFGRAYASAGQPAQRVVCARPCDGSRQLVRQRRRRHVEGVAVLTPRPREHRGIVQRLDRADSRPH